MRGYPQGTAWSIAPRLNVREATRTAQFRRALVSAFSPEELDTGLHFSTPLPPLPPGTSTYHRPTVTIIDDRAGSQAEHTGLFLEVTNGTTFVGTPTAGANGDVTRFPVPGGIWITFTGHDVRHADGRQLQRIGIVPAVEVALTRVGLAAEPTLHRGQSDAETRGDPHVRRAIQGLAQYRLLGLGEQHARREVREHRQQRTAPGDGLLMRHGEDGRHHLLAAPVPGVRSST